MTARDADRLLEAVRRMRALQQAWFSGDKRAFTLEAARRAEREVDRVLADIENGQGSLL